MVRPATINDLPFIYELYMHPSINPFLLYEQMPIDEFQPIYLDLLEKKVKFVYENESGPAGMFKLVQLTYRSDHVGYLGGLAIAPQMTGRGSGYQMMKDILGVARDKGLLRVELTVDEINTKAIHLYEKAGFTREGLLRKYTHMKKEGKFLDEVLMAYLF